MKSNVIKMICNACAAVCINFYMNAFAHRQRRKGQHKKDKEDMLKLIAFKWKWPKKAKA